MMGLDIEARLAEIFAQWGAGAYVLAFALVFVQTANPIGAAIPGSPVLFVLGLLGRTTQGVSLPALFGVLMAGAFLGSLVGYRTGAWLGPRAFERPRLASYAPRLEAFFARHGSKAVAIAFFLPFIRCFMPLFAGASRMEARSFAVYSGVGAAGWIGLFLSAGALFGEIPWVRANLDIAVLVVGLIVGGKIVWSSRKARQGVVADRT